jgi:hypothetical protein
VSRSNKYHYYVEGNDTTLSFDHFGFKEMTIEEANDDACTHFTVECMDTITLQSAFSGELVCNGTITTASTDSLQHLWKRKKMPLPSKPSTRMIPSTLLV